MKSRTIFHYWVSLIEKNIYIFLIILALAFTLPILSSGNNLGIQDWDQQLAYLESARQSVVNYHQFPLWSPYHCGGMPGFANPQSSFISITFLLILLFNTIIGVKISIFIHFAIGLIGFYKLAQYFKLTPAASILSSILFCFSGPISSALGVGMLVFVPVFYMPIVLLFISKAADKKQPLLSSIIAGLLLAASYYHGAHVIFIFLPIFTLYVIYVILRKRSLLILNYFLITFSLFILFSLPKLFLIVDFLFNHSKPIVESTSVYSVKGLIYFLFSRKQSYSTVLPDFPTEYGLDENSLYVGFIAFLFFLIGSFIAKKKRPILIFGLIISLLFMIGGYFPINIWAILRKLPFYEYFRVAQRFRFSFLLFFSLIAGFGFDSFIKLFKRNKQPFIILLILTLLLFDLGSFSISNYLSKTFIIKDVRLSSSSRFTSIEQPGFKFQRIPQVRKFVRQEDLGDYIPFSSEYPYTANNQGLIECYEPLHIDISARGVGNIKYRGEAYLLNNSGTIRIDSWSPNVISISIQDLKKNDILILNQNYNPHWYVRHNSSWVKAKNYSGLVATYVDVTTQRIEFKYKYF